MSSELYLKIVIVGHHNYGSPLENHKFEIMQWIHFHFHTFQVWDVGGQEHIRDLWKHYYDNEEMDGVLFVVDATDENRLKQAKCALQIILSGLSSKNSFICILANKQDKFSKLLPLSLIMEEMDLNNVLKNRKWKLFQVSATTGSGLEDVLKWIMAIE